MSGVPHRKTGPAGVYGNREGQRRRGGSGGGASVKVGTWRSLGIQISEGRPFVKKSQRWLPRSRSHSEPTFKSSEGLPLNNQKGEPRD